jgi:hypothetical protein
MRHLLLGLAVAFGLAAFAPAVQAQATPGFSPGFSDPFFLYYGFYLPRQAYLAAQPTTPNQLNDVAAARQNYALADRAGLYDPNAGNPFAMEQTDPLGPYAPRKGAERLPRPPAHFAQPRVTTNLNNAYFNRTARYYPTMRPGSNANRNLVTASRFARGGFGMPSMYGGSGLPGR